MRQDDTTAMTDADAGSVDVGADTPTCSFCFEGAEGGGEMIAPCLCAGTLKWVHRSCIKRWRRHATDTTRCPNCKYQYKVADIGPEVWAGAALVEIGALLVRLGMLHTVSNIERQVSVATHRTSMFYMHHWGAVSLYPPPELVVCSIGVGRCVGYAARAAIVHGVSRYSNVFDEDYEVPLDFGNMVASIRGELKSLAFAGLETYRAGRLLEAITDIQRLINLPEIYSFAVELYKDIKARITSRAMANSYVLPYTPTLSAA